MFSPQTQASIDLVAELFRQSKYAIALTGAGISTPSGIPDFRSTGTGLWTHDEPLEAASLTVFRTAPEKFYKWFRPLAGQIFNAQPNPAHLALAALEQTGRLRAVITQNIDGLHQKANSKNVVEIHGSMRTLTCSQCYHQTEAALYIAAYVNTGEIPLCPKCNQTLKPDVILFGEQMPHAAWSKARDEARQCDLMLVAGSSLEVMPAAGLPMRALDRGARLVIINNAETYLNVRADATIFEDVALVIPAITEKVLNG